MIILKRYLVEFGTGADLHGMDCTKAAQKAIKDAISHCCLCGIFEILDLSFENICLKVKIAAPYPDQVDINKVKNTLSHGCNNLEVEVVKGGMETQGLFQEALGKGDTIVIVNAALYMLTQNDY